MKIRQGVRLPSLAMALGLMTVVGGCGADFQPPGATGQPAPEYQAVTLDGDPFVLAGLQGDVVLLNIWATWCAPCRWEMPELQQLHRELSGAGLRVVGVSVDAAGSDRSVRAFLDQLGIDFQIVRDPAERISTLLGAYGIPLTVLVDREGIIQWRHLGPVTADDPRLRAALDRTLGPGATEGD
jgi:cytochrome c biogenesis protein CcmG, thiol:disulfide interchange protein DsbE